MNFRKYFGPATLITAAFIGPGTVTVCTIAGATSGYDLLWALLFSIIATIVLQEMAARLGFITGKGLGHAIQSRTPKGLRRYAFIGVVVVAIIIGNAAYEAGNIAGAVLGIEVVISSWSLWPLVLAVLAMLILFAGRYKILEKFLIALVILMSVCFMLTMIVLAPSFAEIMKGFIPSTSFDFLSVMALIGTTVVPYNLFLHAGAIARERATYKSLNEVRTQNTVSILLGGFVSMAILIVSATAFNGKDVAIESATDMAYQLELLLGSWSKWVMAIGLFAAGLSSAITAPLAAGYAASGLFQWDDEKDKERIRSVWMIVLISGVGFSMAQIKPVFLIQFAQIANGLLLPIVAGFLLYLMNDKILLEEYKNNVSKNILGIIIIGITLLISVRILYQVFQFLFGT